MLSADGRESSTLGSVYKSLSVILESGLSYILAIPACVCMAKSPRISQVFLRLSGKHAASTSALTQTKQADTPPCNVRQERQ